MPLIHNERWKLTATALNGVAIATMATGFIAPIAALTYGVSGASGGIFLALISLAWFSTALALHFIARAMLGRLRE